MAVNNFVVSRIINEALQQVNQNGSIRTVVDALYEAWSRVNSRRLQGDCSENYAAAEHYLYSRYLVARFSVFYSPFMDTMTWSYDMFKNFLDLFGGDVPREGSCAPSQPSPEVRDWAYRGSLDGCNDSLGYTRLGFLGAPLNPNQRLWTPVGQLGDSISPNVG